MLDGGRAATHALPHFNVTTSHTVPWNVPAHQLLERLGESTTRTLVPALDGGASTVALHWQLPLL